MADFPPKPRGTDKLVTSVGRDAVEYLNMFHNLSSPADITAWHEFCKNHPSVDLKSKLSFVVKLLDTDIWLQSDWYAHKVSHPWLLPAFNMNLSPMPNEFWELTPNHTNLVETAHVETNRNTNIHLKPLEAIQK